jgi:hypothetical protein
LAASLAATSFTAAPAAAADRGEIARFVVGAGALLLLGNALSHNDRNRSYNDHNYNTYNNHNYNHGHVNRRYNDPVPHVSRRMVAPASCVQHNRWGRGPSQILFRHCLTENMRHTNRLPGQCAYTIQTREGGRTVYSAPCMRRNGWVFG